MRIRALVLPLAVAAAFLAGCTQAGSNPTTTPTPTSNGIEALDAPAIITKANEALGKANSYHMVGSGQQQAAKVDVDMVVAGNNFKGKFGTMGMTIDMISVDGKLYLKADSFIELAGSMVGGTPTPEMATLANAMKGKYIAVPADQAAQFADVPKASDFLDFGGETFTKGEKATLDGKSVLTLSGSDGTKVYVALTGEPYVVQVEGKDGTLKITDIGTAGTITAPAAADVIDYTQLAAQLAGSK